MLEMWGVWLGVGSLCQAVLLLLFCGHSFPQDLWSPSCEVRGQWGWVLAPAGLPSGMQGFLPCLWPPSCAVLAPLGHKDPCGAVSACCHISDCSNGFVTPFKCPMNPQLGLGVGRAE